MGRKASFLQTVCLQRKAGVGVEREPGEDRSTGLNKEWRSIRLEKTQKPSTWLKSELTMI